jgi:Uma2 family endonuclease
MDAMLGGMDEMHTRENNGHEEEDEMTVLQDRPATAETDEDDMMGLDEMFEYIEDGHNPPPGFKVQIIEGAIVMSPQRDVHALVIIEILIAIREVLGRKAKLLFDVRLDVPGWRNGFAPDVMLIRNDAGKLPNGSYRYQDARLVVEVVSRSSRKDDYGHKLEAYALGEIPTYVVADPKLGTVEVHTLPRVISDGVAEYGETHRYRFGDSFVLQDPEVTIDTADWPRD